MLIVRQAGMNDMKAVYDLSNDPIVRAVSFSSEIIPYETHKAWFVSKIHDPDTLFLVFYEGPDLVSQIRFSRITQDIAEISLSISSIFRGKGMGYEIMEEAVSYLQGYWCVDRIQAVVKKDNEVSNRYFMKCGYILAFEGISKNHACNTYFFNLPRQEHG